MTPLTITMLIIFAAISIAYIVITVILFYHIGRYSAIGDASKRVFTLYLASGVLIIFATSIFLIINHIIS